LNDSILQKIFKIELSTNFVKSYSRRPENKYCKNLKQSPKEGPNSSIREVAKGGTRAVWGGKFYLSINFIVDLNFF
jgi:hypothetical protein